jgi:hypothetical protein
VVSGKKDSNKERFMKEENREKLDALIVDGMLVFQQDKRTALETIRIGIRIIVAQIFCLGLLIATSKLYNFLEIKHLMVPFILLNALLFILAAYLISGSLIRLHRLEIQIRRYQSEHNRLSKFAD